MSTAATSLTGKTGKKGTTTKRTRREMMELQESASSDAAAQQSSLVLRVFSQLSKAVYVMTVAVALVVTATTLIPFIGAMVKDMSGLNEGFTFDEMIVAWLLPLVFLCGMLFIAELKLIRMGWARLHSFLDRAALWPLMQPSTKISTKTTKTTKTSART